MTGMGHDVTQCEALIGPPGRQQVQGQVGEKEDLRHELFPKRAKLDTDNHYLFASELLVKPRNPGFHEMPERRAFMLCSISPNAFFFFIPKFDA